MGDLKNHIPDIWKTTLMTEGKLPWISKIPLQGNAWLPFQKLDKEGWKQPKKVFWPAFGCTHLPKAGQNTQISLEGSLNDVIL